MVAAATAINEYWNQSIHRHVLFLTGSIDKESVDGVLFYAQIKQIYLHIIFFLLCFAFIRMISREPFYLIECKLYENGNRISLCGIDHSLVHWHWRVIFITYHQSVIEVMPRYYSHCAMKDVDKFQLNSMQNILAAFIFLIIKNVWHSWWVMQNTSEKKNWKCFNSCCCLLNELEHKILLEMEKPNWFSKIK